jgi:hypothetical protein
MDSGSGVIVEVDSLSIPVSRDGTSTGLTQMGGPGTAVWDNTAVVPMINFHQTVHNAYSSIEWGTFAAPVYSISVYQANPDGPDYVLASGDVVTFPSVVVGYPSVGDELFYIFKTGDSALADLDVNLSGADASSFLLNKNGVNPTQGITGNSWFSIRPVDDLSAGTYTASVTVSDTNLTDFVFTLSFTVSDTSIPTHPVTVIGGTSDKATAAAGETVTITAGVAPAGQAFAGWTTTDGVTFADVAAESTTFIMPVHAVTVTATYQPLEAQYYAISVLNDGNGIANPNVNSAQAGAKITLTATPNSGYRFKEWQVIDGSVTISGNTFTMPESAVTVKAIFEKIPPTPDGKPEVKPQTPKTGDVATFSQTLAVSVLSLACIGGAITNSRASHKRGER